MKEIIEKDFDTIEYNVFIVDFYADIYKDKIIYPCLGLAGETGEVCEKVKKVLRDNNGEFTDEKKEELKKELGDSLWYLNAIANDLGFTLEEVAKANNEKLLKRASENKLHGSGDNR